MDLLAAMLHANHPPIKRLSQYALGMEPVNSGDLSAFLMEKGHLVLGSGWHPSLFHAEVDSLTGVVKILTPRIVQTNSDSGLDDAATVDQILAQPCIGSVATLSDSFSDWLSTNPLNGDESIAIRWSRHGERKPGIKGIELAKEMGGILTDAGYKIELETPGQLIELLIDGEELYWGTPLLKEPPRKGWKDRVATQRPFFKPVSLDPRHARLMLNLAGKKGPLLDPMCGTGGILIESAASGIESTGVDLDPEMVAGTQQNLEWSGAKARVICGDATRLSELDISGIKMVCFDPPYGRNAWRSDSTPELFSSVLDSLHSVCSGDAVVCCMLPTTPDGTLVMGMEWHDVEQLFSSAGWNMDGDWFIPVHASLGRRLVRAVRLHS